MSLIIRFSKVGRKGERKLRIVVKEKRSKRDGRALDLIGYYEKTEDGKVTKKIDEARLAAWLKKGAQLSEGVRKIV